MADLPTYAISVHAPWAWALMYGGKDVENRECRRHGHGGYTFPRTALGRVWVHASLWPGAGPLRDGTRRADDFTDAHDTMVDMFLEASMPGLFELGVKEVFLQVPPASRTAALRGNIVGSIEVHGYRMPNDPPDSPWYVPGSLGILVRDPRPLVTLVPAKGALGWWKPNDDVMAQLREAA